MPVTKSKTPRTTLASQIDRLDRTLDGLADALPEVVADAVRNAVAVALREAIQNAVAEALANPETIESFRQPVQPVAAAVEVTPPEPTVTPPSRFARLRGKLGQTRERFQAFRAVTRQRVKALRVRCVNIGNAVYARRKAVLIATGVALTVAVVSQLVGPFAASLLAGMSGFGVAVLASPAPIA